MSSIYLIFYLNILYFLIIYDKSQKYYAFPSQTSTIRIGLTETDIVVKYNYKMFRIYPQGGLRLKMNTGNIIDVHSHFLSDEYAALLERHNATREDGFPLPQWKAEEHIALMDQ